MRGILYVMCELKAQSNLVARNLMRAVMCGAMPYVYALCGLSCVGSTLGVEYFVPYLTLRPNFILCPKPHAYALCVALCLVCMRYVERYVCAPH